MKRESTEVSCTECSARRKFTGWVTDALSAAYAAGWTPAERQLPGRHVVWARCPECSEPAEASAVRPFIGFDGVPYGIGDSIEIHPGTDLWMQGARYGQVVGSSATAKDRVHVRMDKRPAPRFVGSEDTFRRIV